MIHTVMLMMPTSSHIHPSTTSLARQKNTIYVYIDLNYTVHIGYVKNQGPGKVHAYQGNVSHGKCLKKNSSTDIPLADYYTLYKLYTNPLWEDTLRCSITLHKTS